MPGAARAHPVAYFSAEFGLHQSLPVYSGGLGVLAGDHLKSMSDLGVPVVGVGLLYAQGYVHQHIDDDGNQEDLYEPIDSAELPAEPVLGADGQPVRVEVEMPGRTVRLRIWHVRAGRSRLLLLDASDEANSPEDRELTARLYGGDNETRIQQEMLLGVGGFRALGAIGVHPSVLHLNEGHSAFALLEWARHLVEREGLDPARRRARGRGARRVHHPHAGRGRARPVRPRASPAGTWSALATALGSRSEELLALGSERPGDPAATFCPTVLALKLSRRANGVSALHGRVSRRDVAPPLSRPDRGRGADRPHHQRRPRPHLARRGRCTSCSPGTWVADWTGDDRPAGALGADRTGPGRGALGGPPGAQGAPLRLRPRPAGAIAARGTAGRSRSARLLLDDALTLGFARRFATYKRADLLLQDLDRLDRLVNHPERPAPDRLRRQGPSARHRGQGPGPARRQPGARPALRRPHRVRRELLDSRRAAARAGGGRLAQHAAPPAGGFRHEREKCILNGVLNCSILDGWWAEGYDGSNGFGIGHGEIHSDPAIQDERDAADLFDVLEKEVVPLYYERDADGLPRGWIRRVKRAIRTLAWRYNADRMVKDYVEQCYLPAAGGETSRMA